VLPAYNRYNKQVSESPGFFVSKNLSALFNPRSVAVFGASEKPGSLGLLIFSNLVNSFYQGNIYPINPAHKKVLGHTCYASIKDVSKIVDLAVICAPYSDVGKILQQCGKQGVQAAILMVRGPENDKKRRQWTTKITQVAKAAGVRLVGPNAMGLLRPLSGLNVLYNRNQVKSGPIALVSQSAGLCDALLDWSEAHDVGYSTVMTLGEGEDVGLGEILYYLAREPRTRLLLVYLEEISGAESLLNGLRLAAGLKPVLIFTGGAPSEHCTEAALTRCGAILLRSVDQLFPLIQLLLDKKIPQTDQLSIISNGVGPDYLAAHLLQDYGLEPALIPQELHKKLERFTPTPIRMEQSLVLAAKADASQIEKAITLLGTSTHHSMLLIITPRPETPIDELVDVLTTLASKYSLFICLMGEARVNNARQKLHEHGLNVYTTPAEAIEVFSGAAAYRRQHSLARELPDAYAHEMKNALDSIRALTDLWIDRQNLQPSRSEIQELLSLLELPVPQHSSVSSLKQALSTAELIGYPLLIKPESQNIPSRRGGIWINDQRGLRLHYLALVAERQRHDPQTTSRGAMLEKAEVNRPETYKISIRLSRHELWKRILEIRTPHTQDSCVLLPLSPLLVADLFRRSGLAQNPLLTDLILRLSSLISEIPDIELLELNPVWVNDSNLYIGDSLLRLSQDKAEQPYQHLLIHPYPPELERREPLEGDQTLLIRPLKPDDADQADRFMNHVSRASLYQRFLQPLPELSDSLITQLTLLDMHNQLALGALIEPGNEPVGIARYARDGDNCEFSILVRDEWQGKGMGKRLMQQLITVAESYEYQSIYGLVLPDNKGMLHLAQSLGFHQEHDADLGLIRVSLKLSQD
jgi:acetyltransferase